MSTTVLAAADSSRTAVNRSLTIGLLGCGRVGGAIARAARQARDPSIRIASVLVRDAARSRPDVLPADAALTEDPCQVLAARPDVLVEVLGGVDAARAIVTAALATGVPVVTANKSLLAAHGDELFELAEATGTPLRYEAAVVAGVPFLGATRQRTAHVTRLTGIVNGTSNFILTFMRERGVDRAAALAEAQRLGLAEPDPRNDVESIDAAEKLAVLLRHYGCASVVPSSIERAGLGAIEHRDLEQAALFGGVLKPLALAEVREGSVVAFAGPAFLPAAHPLAAVNGVENALAVDTTHGRLMFAGPGAGPEPTAATVLDDVREAAAGRTATPAARPAPSRLVPSAPATGWFIRLTGQPSLPDVGDIADLLGAHGVWARRWSDPDSRDGSTTLWALTLPASAQQIGAACDAVAGASGCRTLAVRAPEAA